MKKQIINLKTILAALTMLTVTSCADEDLMPNVGQAGQLHIASVGVGDNKVASRNGEAVEGTTSIVIPSGYNEVLKEVSSLTLKYTFANSNDLDKTATASKSNNGWTITASDGNILQPSAGEKWENLKIEATNIISAGFINLNEEPWSGADNLYVYKDKVSATSIGDGGITVDTDVASAYLGKMTITLSHDHALLSLAQDKYIVESGTYIKDDKPYQVTELDILWAELSKGQSTIYVPLTTGTNCLQAIVPVDYKLTGFRAVMKVGVSQKFYLDFDVSQELSRNMQYNLKLTITPNYQGIELQQTDRPGWGKNFTTLKDWKQSAGLKYNAQTKTFEVSDANGLLLLNLWMTGTGDEIKHIEGYRNIDKTASRMSHNIKITNDIDFGAEHRIFDLDGNGDNMSNWKPLGDSGNEYTGTFDGNNKTITGLAIFTNNGTAGLADRLGEGGVIKNLTISEATVSTNLDHTGIVAAYTAGIIENCKVVSSSVTGSGDWVGAIAGSNLGTIIACQVSGTTKVKGLKHVAGIAGSNSGNVVACSTSSNLTLTATNDEEPKIAGLVSDNKGKVYGSWTTRVNNSGGTGNGVYSNNTHVYNCFAASTIDEVKVNVGETNAVNGTMNYAIALYNQTLASGANDPAYCNWHWANTDGNIQLTSGAPTATFSLTYVSETRTFQVYDAAGLQLVTEWMWKGRPVSNANQESSKKFTDYTIYYNAANPNGDSSTEDDVDKEILSIPGFDSSINKEAESYTNGVKEGTAILDRFTYNIKLMNDITFGNNDKIYNLNKRDGDANDSNFLYIAGDNCSFSGTIDGNGKTITGLIIDSDRSQTGLVDVMAVGGVIKNLTLEVAFVTASADDTGMFVSANSGIVSNCRVNGGTVHGEDGGIAVFVGSHGATGIIENCSAANVSICNKSYKDDNTGINEDVNLAGIAGRGSGKINNCSVTVIKFYVTHFDASKKVDNVTSKVDFWVGNIAGNSGLVVTESTSNTCKIWKNNDQGEGTTYNYDLGQVVSFAANQN